MNRFQALVSAPDDLLRNVMREEDMELEMEVNNELQNSGIEEHNRDNEENDTSHGSEFVEATQNFAENQDSHST